jgi:hypothetical protein
MSAMQRSKVLSMERQLRTLEEYEPCWVRFLRIFQFNDNELTTRIGKGNDAQKAAIDDYFKHFDNKKAEDETEEDRQARRAEYATLTRHYYNLATDLYEYGWSQSFHFCR